jgi:hypothetical protein
MVKKKNLGRVVSIILIATGLSYFQYSFLLSRDLLERFYLLSIGVLLVLLNTGLAYIFYYIATRYAILMSKYRWLAHAMLLVALALCFLWLSAYTGYVLLEQRACRDGFGAVPIIPDCFIEPYYTSVLSLGYQLPVYYQYVLPLIYGLIGYGLVIIVRYIVRRWKSLH